MIKEYQKFIKDYLKLSQTKTRYFLGMLFSAIGYKAFLVLNTLFASWIIKYATNSNLNMTYLSLILLVISYTLYQILLFINCKIYGKDMNYSYTTLQTKILNKLVSVDDNFTRKISKGKLINSIDKDVREIGDMCDQIAELYTTIIQVFVVCIIVALYNIYIAIIFLMYSILFLFIRNDVDRKGAIYYKKQKHEVDRYSNLF